MKVTPSPVLRSRYTVHDGVLPSNTGTTCKRCLKLRASKPYVHNKTLREESQ